MPRTLVLWIFVAVAIATFLVFWPATRNDFVNLDDPDLLLNNPHFRQLNLRSLQWMLTTTHKGPYQPLAWMSYAIDYTLWGLDPFGFHLTNLLVHSASAGVFFILAATLFPLAVPRFKGHAATLYGSAALAALLFAWHPLRVEPVAWASERRLLLAGFFFFLAFLFYLKAHTDSPSRAKRWRIASLGAYLLSVLSQALALSFPAVLIVIDIYPLRRLPGSPFKWLDPTYRTLWREKIPYLVLALAAGASAWLGHEEAKALHSLEHTGVLSRLSQAAFGSAFYLGKTLIPHGLLPFYERPVHWDPASGSILISAVVVIIATATLFALRRRFPAGLTAWVCYLLILFPVSGFMPLGRHLAADRYSYLSCASWPLLVAGSMYYVSSLKGSWRSRIFSFVTPLLVSIIIGFAYISRRQILVWRNSENLWSRVLAYNPMSSVAHMGLGHTLLSKPERLDLAIKHLRTSLEIRPGYALAHFNLANALLRRGDLPQATESYRNALSIRPDDAAFHNGLGIALARKGNFNKAIEHFGKAVERDPGHAEASNNLGDAFSLLGKPDQAMEHYRRTLRYDPNNLDANNNLGIVLVRRGQREEAIFHFRRALKIDPSNIEAKRNLALANRGAGLRLRALSRPQSEESPQIVTPGKFIFTFENPDLPELRKFAQEENFIQLCGELSDLSKVACIGRWVRSELVVGAPFVYPPWNARTILRLTREKGLKTFCGQDAIVFAQALWASGGPGPLCGSP